MQTPPDPFPTPPRPIPAGAEPELTPEYWQDRYETGRTGWDRGAVNPQLEVWLAKGVLTPGRILVPGCGRGHEVLRLAAAGYQVTALDYAAAAVAHLQTELAKAHLSAEVVAQDVLSFCTDEPFAAIYEQTCLCAIQPTLWSRYAERLYQLLTDQGRLCILFMQSHTAHGPPFHCDLAQMQTLFPASRWDWQGEPMRVEHPLGLYELACVLEKRKN